MDDVVLARHGESETAARGVVGGDAPLTERGRDEAAALGVELGAVPFDVCLTSAALRARETADIALEGRAVPREVVSELADIDFGDLEGRPLGEYREWIGAHAPADAPPGGESRVATLRRLTAAYRGLLARPEPHVLVVAHGIALSALVDERPRPVVAGVPYGTWIQLTRSELVDALARLEAWCEAPAW
jgi:2,3-bisphosphoglycerate-dependent phosphoglycerate mutase